jgi:hypothetical protein
VRLRLNRTAVLLGTLAPIVAATTDAVAQNAGRIQRGTIEENAAKLDVGASKQNPASLGHEIAPGVVFSPTVTLESGYSTNPDELFAGAEESPYGLTNTTGVFGFLNTAGATTLALRGSYNQWSDDIQRSGRWDAGIAVDNAYVVAPKTIATFGAFYLRDELSSIASDNGGGYGQLAYKEDDFETFARVKADQIAYVTDVESATATPVELLLLQPSQFDMRRVEMVSGFIFGPNARIGVYGELGGGAIDYTEQTVEGILDRDADELWAITGLRLNLHKSLVVDAGWRFNFRETDDTSIDALESNYLDGRITWTPHETLQIVAEVDRRYSEPLSTLAIVSDKTHYGISVVYKVRPDVEISGGFRHDQIDQIGDVFEYRETEWSFSIAHQWSESTTVYGLLLHEHVEELTTDQSYDKLQVGGGTRVRF